MRTLLAFLLCWVTAGLWLCWDDLMALTRGQPVFTLGVFLSFVYTLIPLGAASLVAAAAGYLLKLRWTLRGTMAAVTSGGIVLIFLVATGQFAVLPVLAFCGLGFAIGCLTTRSPIATKAEQRAST